MEEASDGAFLEWVGRSQLYSGDVLAPEALQDLTGWMAEAGPGDKRQMMALLRDLHATISPTGYGPALPCWWKCFNVMLAGPGEPLMLTLLTSCSYC